MNRKERRKALKQQHAHVKQFPDELTLLPQDAMPKSGELPLKAWVSKKYLVELWNAGNHVYPHMIRLSICRTKLNPNGRWQDGLTWDELQSIKNAVGFGDWYGVEIYPPDSAVVNVANFRHLWLMPRPLAIGWGVDAT